MTWPEKAVRFGPDAGLLGILTLPPHPLPSVPGVILMNPGTLHRVGGARLNVRLARRLASEGHPSLRFDLSGLGDSDTRLDGRPYIESMVADLRAAMDALEGEVGVESFMLIGHCTGAAISYHTALADSRVAGVAQIEGFAYQTPAFHYHHWKRILLKPSNWSALVRGKKDIRPMLRRAFERLGQGSERLGPQVAKESTQDARRRIRGLGDLLPPKAEMHDGLQHLVARGVSMLNIYAGGDHHYYAYRRQFSDAFRGLDFRGLLALEHVTDADHYFSSPDHQAWLDARVSQWASRLGRRQPS